MFDKIRYQIKTYNYFEPYDETTVDSDDLLKILRGKVRNPHTLENPKSTTDYGYFVICNVGIGKLQGTKERKFECSMIEDIFYKSQWFGQFECDSGSSIVIPNKYEIHLSSDNNLAFVSERTDCVWYGGGFYQCDKNDGDRILTTDVSLDEMVGLVKKVYSGRDISRSLDKLK